MPGGFHYRPCEKIADDIFANVLVLNDGEKDVLIISLDVCKPPDDFPFPVYEEIYAKTGIKKENIYMVATHTHSSVSIGEKAFSDSSEPNDDSYKVGVWNGIINAVCEAAQKRQNAKIGVCSRDNKEFLHNRRFEAPDGTAVQNWAHFETLSKCVENGVIDPEILALKITSEDGGEIAFIINYSMHVNAFNRGLEISADYPGVISDILRSVYGDSVVVLFMSAAAGDTNCYDQFFKFPMPDMWKYRHLYVGRSLAGTILGMDAFYEFLDQPDFHSGIDTLKIGERPFRPLDDVIDFTFGPPEKTKEYWWDVYAEQKKLWMEERKGNLEVYDFPVGFLAFGKDLAVVTVASEFFVELGKRIKEGSPFKHTMIWELTNGSYGYIPTMEAFAKGGYETRKLGTNPCMVEEAGDIIVGHAVTRLKEIYEGLK